jgi:DUF1680 family protein
VHCFCCPPSLARTLAQLHTYAYGISEDAVWVHLYGSSRLDAPLPESGAIKLTQTTDYPWDGKITIRIEQAPEKEMGLRLRIPNWAETATVTCNGEPAAGTFSPGSYGEIRRRWSSGDSVELNLPMPVVMQESHPLVEENSNQVAVMRGPLVYCLESMDLPEGVALEDVGVVRDAPWKVRHEAELLNGVTLLETEGAALPRATDADALYGRLPAGQPTSIPLRLIPYYAWSNRGQSQMTVWLPVLWR